MFTASGELHSSTSGVTIFANTTTGEGDNDDEPLLQLGLDDVDSEDEEDEQDEDEDVDEDEDEGAGDDEEDEEEEEEEVEVDDSARCLASRSRIVSAIRASAVAYPSNPSNDNIILCSQSLPCLPLLSGARCCMVDSRCLPR